MPKTREGVIIVLKNSEQFSAIIDLDLLNEKDEIIIFKGFSHMKLKKSDLNNYLIGRQMEGGF